MKEKLLNGSQLAKMEKKSRFLTCPCHKIYREQAVGLESSNLYLENYVFCEYTKFWTIFRKIWYFVNNRLIKVRI